MTYRVYLIVWFLNKQKYRKAISKINSYKLIHNLSSHQKQIFERKREANTASLAVATTVHHDNLGSLSCKKKFESIFTLLEVKHRTLTITHTRKKNLSTNEIKKCAFFSYFFLLNQITYKGTRHVVTINGVLAMNYSRLALPIFP